MQGCRSCQVGSDLRSNEFSVLSLIGDRIQCFTCKSPGYVELFLHFNQKEDWILGSGVFSCILKASDCPQLDRHLICSQSLRTSDWLEVRDPLQERSLFELWLDVALLAVTVAKREVNWSSALSLSSLCCQILQRQRKKAAILCVFCKGIKPIQPFLTCAGDRLESQSPDNMGKYASFQLVPKGQGSVINL